MSGVYISGLKMPEEDGVLTLRIWGNGLVESIESYHSWLLSGVKAIPAPDHGRLIDADALQKIMRRGREYVAGLEWNIQVGASKGLDAAVYMVEDAQTIIPGEERS